MPDNSALSMESAVALMNAAPAADAEPIAPVNADGSAIAQADNEPDKATPAKAEAATETDASEDVKAADEADKDTPSADEGETNDEDADQGDALPTIEPPSSWKAEEKDVFKSLPRAAQEAIARREQDRTTELRNLQNGQAEQRKTVDAEVAKLKGLAEKISAHVQTEISALAQAFPEIKSEADVAALAERDPARFAVFQAKLMQFNSARQAEADAQTELAQKANQQQQESLGQAKTALLEAFPTWKDPQVARKELTELQDYAISMGASEQTARQALDPVVYKLAQKARLYDQAQAAKAKAITRDPPRTIKPGASNSGSKADMKTQDRQSRLSKLAKSGDIEDALSLMRA